MAMAAQTVIACRSALTLEPMFQLAPDLLPGGLPPCCRSACNLTLVVKIRILGCVAGLAQESRVSQPDQLRYDPK
jgi:hypothetical protein